jgi:hypothetical protein
VRVRRCTELRCSNGAFSRYHNISDDRSCDAHWMATGAMACHLQLFRHPNTICLPPAEYTQSLAASKTRSGPSSIISSGSERVGQSKGLARSRDCLFSLHGLRARAIHLYLVHVKLLRMDESLLVFIHPVPPTGAKKSWYNKRSPVMSAKPVTVPLFFVPTGVPALL